MSLDEKTRRLLKQTLKEYSERDIPDDYDPFPAIYIRLQRQGLLDETNSANQKKGKVKIMPLQELEKQSQPDYDTGLKRTARPRGLRLLGAGVAILLLVAIAGVVVLALRNSEPPVNFTPATQVVVLGPTLANSEPTATLAPTNPTQAATPTEQAVTATSVAPTATPVLGTNTTQPAVSMTQKVATAIPPPPTAIPTMDHSQPDLRASYVSVQIGKQVVIYGDNYPISTTIKLMGNVGTQKQNPGIFIADIKIDRNGDGGFVLPLTLDKLPNGDSYQAGSFVLWVMGFDATPLTLTLTPPLEANPLPGSTTFNGGNNPGMLVYEERDPNASDDTSNSIVAVSLDGKYKKQLASGFDPLISRNGRQLAYFVDLGKQSKDQIYDLWEMRTVNIDGTNPQAHCQTNSVGLLDWSPDGRYVFMRGSQNGPMLVRACDLQTNKMFELHIGAKDGLPYMAGLPICTKSSCVENHDPYVFQIYDWLADGNVIWESGPWGDWRLYAKTQGSQNKVELAQGQHRELWVSEGFGYSNAKVSPDGKTIAIIGDRLFFISAPGQKSPLEGKNIPGIYLPSGAYFTLHWSLNGRYLSIDSQIVDTQTGQLVPNFHGDKIYGWAAL